MPRASGPGFVPAVLLCRKLSAHTTGLPVLVQVRVLAGAGSRKGTVFLGPNLNGDAAKGQGEESDTEQYEFHRGFRLCKDIKKAPQWGLSIGIRPGESVGKISYDVFHGRSGIPAFGFNGDVAYAFLAIGQGQEFIAIAEIAQYP